MSLNYYYYYVQTKLKTISNKTYQRCITNTCTGMAEMQKEKGKQAGWDGAQSLQQ